MYWTEKNVVLNPGKITLLAQTQKNSLIYSKHLADSFSNLYIWKNYLQYNFEFAISKYF